MERRAAIEAVREELKTLERKIEEQRVALAEHAGKDVYRNDDWDQMLRAHARVRDALRDSESLTSQIVEGLRLDIDVIRHSFRRWMQRNDHV